MEEFDVVILGGGKGGKTLAMDLGKAGKKTALIERSMIGGSCINVACIPTKTMIESAKMVERVNRSSSYGIDEENIHVNLKQIIARKRSVVSEMSNANRHQFLTTPNLDFLFGEGHFIGDKTIEVKLKEGIRTLRGKQVIINTGSRPLIPRIDGIDQITPFTSESLMENEVLPKHLIVIGGGYIGLEFGQMFRRFGSQVSLIHHHAQLLPKEDSEIGQLIHQYLEEDGIHFYLQSQPEKISQSGDQIIIECLDATKKRFEIKGTHLLVATGRKPNTEALNLKATGVELDPKGFIKVNERLQTSQTNIWALGDVNGGPQFTHVSLDDFRIVRSQILQGAVRSTQGRLIPYTVFLDPPLGRVGLTEKDALAKGYKIKVMKLEVKNIPRAKTTDERKGLWKAIIDATNDQILGASLLSVDGGEVLGTIQAAMFGKLPYMTLRDAIFSHPTLVEGLNMLFT